MLRLFRSNFKNGASLDAGSVLLLCKLTLSRISSTISTQKLETAIKIFRLFFLVTDLCFRRVFSLFACYKPPSHHFQLPKYLKCCQRLHNFFCLCHPTSALANSVLSVLSLCLSVCLFVFLSLSAPLSLPPPLIFTTYIAGRSLFFTLCPAFFLVLILKIFI